MLKRFIQYYKPHKKLFFLDMSVALAASALAILFPYVTRLLLKQYLPERNVKVIVVLLSAIFILYIFKTFFSYIRIKWGHILGTRMEYDMRSDIFRHLQKLSFNYYDNVKTGHIMSRITNDLNQITEIAHHAPEDLLISICMIIGAFIFMFQFNVTLALIALCPVPIMLLWGIIVGRPLKKSFRIIRKKIADINSSVENSMQGIREVKSYANEELEISKFEKVNYQFRMSKENIFSLTGVFFAVMNFLRDIYYYAVVVGGIWLIYNKKMDIPDLLAFLLYVSIILPPIDRLIHFVEQFYQGSASFERFIEIMDIEPDMQDREGAYSLSQLKGKIEINAITFKYKGGSKNVLNNISMKINSGQSIAIVGESGAGKSTIASLIPRFYETKKGTILIDNHNIMDLRQKFLRETIGIVQQNAFLFDTTIGDNILYGKPAAKEMELIRAAKQAHIYDFISALPDGFNTLVGERGIKLSGGQKQRISIARVFLKNPPVLIFDEATSSLDTESEKLIQKALVKLSKDRTTIIIAHRLSTVRHVDHIYAMQNGQIIESGSHKALLQNKGYYYNLYSQNLL